jgi:hypothetical protein
MGDNGRAVRVLTFGRAIALVVLGFCGGALAGYLLKMTEAL